MRKTFSLLLAAAAAASVSAFAPVSVPADLRTRARAQVRARPPAAARVPGVAARALATTGARGAHRRPRLGRWRSAPPRWPRSRVPPRYRLPAGESAPSPRAAALRAAPPGSRAAPPQRARPSDERLAAQRAQGPALDDGQESRRRARTIPPRPSAVRPPPLSARHAFVLTRYARGRSAPASWAAACWSRWRPPRSAEALPEMLRALLCF
jgi:hypothetical protein